MQREQLQQAMNNRRAKKAQKVIDEKMRVNSREISGSRLGLTTANQQSQLEVSYSVPYLESKQPQIVDQSVVPSQRLNSTANVLSINAGATLNVHNSSIAVNSGHNEPKNKADLSNIDNDLKELQEFYQSASVSMNQKQSENSYADKSATRVANNRYLDQSSQLSSESPTISIPPRPKSLTESVSMLNASPLKEQSPNRPNIPRPAGGGTLVDRLKQQVQEQENLIQKYQQECQSLSNQLNILKQQTPADEKSKDQLIERLKRDVINLREENEAYQMKYDKTIKELLEEIQKLTELNDERKFMLSQINEVVTKQKKTFDFEGLMVQLQKWANSEGGNDAFYITKIKEAVDDVNYMKNLVKEKEQKIEEQRQKLIEQEKAIYNGAQNGTLKQDVAAKNRQIERMGEELLALRKELADNQKLLGAKAQAAERANPSGAAAQQQKYEAKIGVLEEQVRLLQQKLLVQEEESLNRCRQMSEAEDERVARIRSNLDAQLDSIRRQLSDTVLENDALRLQKQTAEQKYENLAKQYEVEKMREYEKRLSRLEEVPDSKYMNEIVQRAVLAENQLKTERERFRRACEDNQKRLQEYQQEIEELMQELQYVM